MNRLRRLLARLPHPDRIVGAFLGLGLIALLASGCALVPPRTQDGRLPTVNGYCWSPGAGWQPSDDGCVLDPAYTIPTTTAPQSTGCEHSSNYPAPPGCPDDGSGPR